MMFPAFMMFLGVETAMGNIVCSSFTITDYGVPALTACFSGSFQSILAFRALVAL